MMYVHGHPGTSEIGRWFRAVSCRAKKKEHVKGDPLSDSVCVCRLPLPSLSCSLPSVSSQREAGPGATAHDAPHADFGCAERRPVASVQAGLHLASVYGRLFTDGWEGSAAIWRTVQACGECGLLIWRAALGRHLVRMTLSALARTSVCVSLSLSLSLPRSLSTLHSLSVPLICESLHVRRSGPVLAAV